MTNTISGTYAYIYFTRLIYENANYPIIDKPVEFDANLLVEDEIVERNHISQMVTIDTENNLIISDIYDVYENESATYGRIEVGFDFDTELVSMINLYIGNVNELDDLDTILIAATYKDDVLKEFKYDDETALKAFAYEINETYYTPYKEKLEDTYKSDLDFSREYTESLMIK